MQIIEKKTFDTCVSDKHLERLKVRVTNYQIGDAGLSNQDQKVEKQLIIWLNIDLIAFLKMKCQVIKINW